MPDPSAVEKPRPATSVLAGRLLPVLVLAATSVVLLPVFAADSTEAIDSEARVSPDRIDDVPSLTLGGNNFRPFDHFAWRAFIALNWPSRTEPGLRGIPDRSKALGDPGPRVWETFKARYELFQVDRDGRPIAPPPWPTYDGANPCGADVDGREKTLASFSPFQDFNQLVSPNRATNALVAQNRTYTRYETRLNEPHYSALALSGWSQGLNLPDPVHPARIPEGSVAVKAAWRLLTDADTPQIRARYYVVENANVVDVGKTREAGRVVCSREDVALVGLHIVIRTEHRPQGIWSTFEHIDNVPPRTEEPDAADAGMPYSYFDARKPKLGLWPPLESPDVRPLSLADPPELDPEPMQIVRRHPIHFSTIERNRRYAALEGIEGTVWQNYMLVANQWPSRAHPIDPLNDGVYFPEKREQNLANTTIETYYQDPPANCMSCHRVFNRRGHDFVGILGSFR